jgi:UDP-N-acetylmuramoyl-L-alanine---L-glutamate ligase
MPKIAIAGFGMEGRALYEYLKGEGAVSIFSEERPHDLPEGASFTEGLVIPADIDIVYKSPGIPSGKLMLASSATKVSTLMDLVLEKVGSRTIGITGTKGKSTTASLIQHLLASAGKDAVLFGNIGIADMDILASDTPDRIYVIELSSYQCEHLSHSPHVAVMTNFFPEHLSHHGSLDRYREAKLNIARFQGTDDLYIDGSDLRVSFAGQVAKPEPASYETKLPGAHNQRNIALAVRAVQEFGVGEEAARAAVRTFEPLPYRLEPVGTHRGVAFYDDSLATVPEATLASIAALPRVDTLILGGQDRGIDFAPFAHELKKSAITTFIVFPETGPRMVAEVGERTVIPVADMESAVRAAYLNTPKDGTVLLSNASPSFNIFRDYRDKSAQYRRWIEELGTNA